MGTDSTEVRQLVKALEQIVEDGRVASASRGSTAGYLAEMALREHYSRQAVRQLR